jgi:hypothetical protein
MADRRLNALCLDMVTKAIELVRIDPDEHAAVARAIFRPSFRLIQDELR